jgi:D-sedoheptulose 7-phosphate isomerase
MMNTHTKFPFIKEIEESIQVKTAILSNPALLQSIFDAAQLIYQASDARSRVIFAGNGGSAADAQHLAAEFVSRFEFDRPGLPALSLSTDTSMLTAIGNDYGYEKLFVRQLEAQTKPGDVFVGITTSGQSKNILAALKACKSLGVSSVALCGLGGFEIDSIADHVIRVPSYSTARIQESHIMIGHIICGFVESHVFSGFDPRQSENS